MPSTTVRWLDRVLRPLSAAVALPEPTQAFTAVLAEHGVATFVGADAGVWIRLDEGARNVCLGAPAEATDVETRAVIANLVRAALARVVAHEQHRKVCERADMLSSASFEGIMVHIDGVIIDTNQRLAELLGEAPAEVLGPHTMTRCVAPEDLSEVLTRVRERYEGTYVITGVRKDGARFRAELQSKQGHLGDRPVRVVAVRDVTARENANTTLDGETVRIAGLRDLRKERRLETERANLVKQVERAQRMESLGVLAGGIAHDFNNLLVGVLGNAELLLDHVTDPGDRQSVQAILSAGERAASLTSQMLAYAGRRDLTRAAARFPSCCHRAISTPRPRPRWIAR